MDTAKTLYIYNEALFPIKKLKRFIKNALGKAYRGPEAVERSLFDGLTELGIPWVLNSFEPKTGATACVLNGEKVLSWVLEKKAAGVFKKVVAGPNIVIMPQDFNGLITSPLIDAYVVPAQWSIDWWVSLEPKMARVLKIWPAGVKDKGVLRNKNGKCLVYKKTVPEDLFQNIISELKSRGIEFSVIEYGKFTPDEYTKALSQSSYLVYLTEHESQGLALHEAWMGNVPTLVWNPGKFVYADRQWQSEKLSAPWLTEEAGMAFKSADDFAVRLKEFIEHLEAFAPRKYALENFTDKKSAEIYLKIIGQIPA